MLPVPSPIQSCNSGWTRCETPRTLIENMLQPGTIIGRKYRILRLIGDGGMGSVYEAEHQVLGSHVALKFLHPEIAEQANLTQRFLQEARVSATVMDEHIVRVTDVDTSDDGAYLVMELLNGEPLTSLIEREGRLNVERAVHFALQIGLGLQAAHARSIVHRDLKPDNVFVTPTAAGPLLKLLDFGIAKLRQSEEYQQTLTRPGSIMGTPEYMAPEQAFGAETVDQRSDIYSLGVMLFEMLSGKVPVAGENPQEIAEEVLHGRALRLGLLRPELPPGLVAIVERAMAPNPDARFDTVAEMSSALLPFAPLTERVSAASLLPNPSRGYSTGLSTPFTPIATTPRIQQGDASEVDFAASPTSVAELNYAPMRESAVPPTLPPGDGPPESQLPQQLRAKTQSMPATTGPVGGHAIARAPTVSGRRKSQGSGALPWILGGAVLCGAAVGGWFYYDEYIAPHPTPPPQPELRLTNSGPVDISPAPDLAEPGVPNFGGPEVERPSGGGQTPRVPGGTPPNVPQFPTFSLPTELPQLPPLPTELPPGIPTTLPFPGFPPLSTSSP